MKLVIRFILVATVLSLTGCSYLSSSLEYRDKAYLKAKSIPPLRIPPGVASSSFENSYPVSNRQYPIVQEDVSTTPPGLPTK